METISDSKIKLGPGSHSVDLPVGAFVLDKHGREIKPGDVLKVWHFIGARRKVHYMYKWVLREEKLGKNQTPFLRVSHLSTGDVEKGYWLQKDGSKLEDYEIVEGYGENYDPFDRRPILCPNVSDHRCLPVAGQMQQGGPSNEE
jgi:hypothetical protein